MLYFTLSTCHALVEQMETSFQQLTTADIADVQDLAKQSKFLRESYSQDPNSDLAELRTCMKVPGLSTQSNDNKKTSVQHSYRTEGIHASCQSRRPAQQALSLFQLEQLTVSLDKLYVIRLCCAACEKLAPSSKKLSSNASSCQALLLLVKLYLPGYSPIWGLSAHTAQCKPSQTAF